MSKILPEVSGELDKRKRSTRFLTDAEKVSIIAMKAKHLSNYKIAKQIGVTPQSVGDFLKRTRELMATSQGIEYDWKQDLESRSVDAITDAFEYDGEGVDVYKRGRIGIDVLKGLGIMNPDQTNVNINALINATPPEMRDRYFVTNNEEGNGERTED
jgi:hypothetical protein